MLKLARKNVLAHKRRLLRHRAVGHHRHRLPGRHVRVHRHDQAHLRQPLRRRLQEHRRLRPLATESIERGLRPDDSGRRIPDSVVHRSRPSPGVAEAEGNVQGFARIIGKDGKPLGQDQGAAHASAVNVYAGDAVAVDASPKAGCPSGANEVVLDRASFKNGKFALGDPVTIVSQGGSKQFTLVGVVPLRRRRLAAVAPRSPCSTCRRRRRSSASPAWSTPSLGKGDGIGQPGRAGPAASQAHDATTASRCSRARQITKENAVRHPQDALSVLQHPAARVRRASPCSSAPSSSTTRSRSSWPSGSGRRRCCGPSAPAGARSSGADRRVDRRRARRVAHRLRRRHPDVEGPEERACRRARRRHPRRAALVLLPRTLIVSLIVGRGDHRAVGGHAGRSAPRACRRWRRCETSPSTRRARSRARLIWGLVLTGLGAVLLGARAWPDEPGPARPRHPADLHRRVRARPAHRPAGRPRSSARRCPAFAGIAGHAGAGELHAQPEAHGPHGRRAHGGRRPRGRHLRAGGVDQGSVRDIFEKQFTGDFVVSTQHSASAACR